MPPAERLREGDDDAGMATRTEPDLIERAMRNSHHAPPAALAGEPVPRGDDNEVPPISVARPPSFAATPAAVKLELDARMLRQMNFITPSSERTQLGEEFRRIKRHVLANVLNPRRGTAANLVMITSALPGEGKTFCSINLAMSMAMELNRTVILVDADTVKPNVLQSLGIRKTLRGLMDLLADPSLAVADVICDTSISNLRVLPAGTAQRRSTELLASDAMKRLVLELAGPYDDRIVIFDSPPLLVASEADALAAHMSQVIMVVAAGQTTELALKDALRRLEGCGSPVGMVLNKQLNPGANYGYYSHGYGPAQGASHAT